MQNSRKVLLAILMGLYLPVIILQAQTTAPRSFYVRADGNDNNNGRSEDAPFETLEKAIEMASAGAIKTITVIGTFERVSISRKTGSSEIIITGKSNVLGEEEKAVFGGCGINGNGKIHFKRIQLSGLRISGNPTVTLGEGSIVTGGGISISIGDGSRGAVLNMVDNSIITGCANNGITAYEATINMSGDSKISNNGGAGIFIDNNWTGNGGTVILSGNALIDNNSGRGIEFESSGNYHQDGNLTMSGNATISNNKTSENGGGVFLQNGPIVISENAVIKNNTSGGSGGGIFGNVTLKGGKISGNTAKRGGGIFSYKLSEMSGGEISENKAEYGAGIAVIGGGTFNFTGGRITKNEAEFVGGGIYVLSEGKYNVKGGSVTGNTAGDGEGHDVFKQ
jgi:hypothetical protein